MPALTSCWPSAAESSALAAIDTIRRIWNPCAVEINPASSKNRPRKFARARSPLIVPINNPDRFPCRRIAKFASAAASSLANCERAGSSSGKNTWIAGFMRRKNAASAPFTKITPAPEERDIE